MARIAGGRLVGGATCKTALSLLVPLFRYTTTLSLDEVTEKDKFLEECNADPSLRDKMSILNRTFQNKKRVGRLC